MRNQTIEPSTVPGWGIDADPENDPTYPIRMSADHADPDWQRPPLQDETVEVLQSVEHDRRPAVFGTSTPPRGLSGVIRRRAFRYSEAQWAHWFLLIAADRVDVVEGLLRDLGRGRIPNIPVEIGLRAELAHNRAGLLKKLAFTAATVSLGYVVLKMISPKAELRRGGTLKRRWH